MTGLTQNREKTEMLAGIITMGVAVLLIIVAMIVMTKCTAEAPESTSGSPASLDTVQTEPTLPPLEVNPYGAGDFAYNNGYLTCLAGKSTLGIDVSSHQGTIDWAKVAQTDIGFAMVRIGYRGYGDGKLCVDSMWQDNVQGAQENGLMVGIYFFSQAITVEEAVEEAKFVVELLDGMDLDLPIVFDWEQISDTARTANMDAQILTACALAFCRQVEKAGYEPMVYFNIDITNRLLDLEQVQQSGYKFWLAMYTDRMTYPNKIDMWQYTDGGMVPGINGNVDLNLYFIYE